VTQGATKPRVESLPAHVSHHLGGQAGEQATQRLRPVALHGQEALQLRDNLLDELPLARRPTPIRLRSRRLAIVLRCGSAQSPVIPQPMPLARERGEALVGQRIGFVVVAGESQRISENYTSTRFVDRPKNGLYGRCPPHRGVAVVGPLTTSARRRCCDGETSAKGHPSLSHPDGRRRFVPDPAALARSSERNEIRRGVDAI
jgi:hypothetical protein